MCMEWSRTMERIPANHRQSSLLCRCCQCYIKALALGAAVQELRSAGLGKGAQKKNIKRQMPSLILHGSSSPTGHGPLSPTVRQPSGPLNPTIRERMGISVRQSMGLSVRQHMDISVRQSENPWASQSDSPTAHGPPIPTVRQHMLVSEPTKMNI